MIELCPIMFRLEIGIWPILGLKFAILVIFYKISTSNLFCQSSSAKGTMVSQSLLHLEALSVR